MVLFVALQMFHLQKIHIRIRAAVQHFLRTLSQQCCPSSALYNLIPMTAVVVQLAVGYQTALSFKFVMIF